MNDLSSWTWGQLEVGLELRKGLGLYHTFVRRPIERVV